MAAKAKLVFGPESSGTRLMTSVFIAAGCEGDDTHAQRFDSQFPSDNLIVWRRSFPHAHGWPRATLLIHRLRRINYEVQVAVMMRDWHCIARSQLDRHHANRVGTALDRIQEAYRRIFDTLNKTHVNYVMISYESLVQRPQKALASLMPMFDLPVPDINICDANAKHYSTPIEQDTSCG